MRIAFLGTFVAAGVALTSGTALAADPTPTGIEVGLRSGYALPLGDATGAPSGGQSTPLSDSISGVVPIWIDAGYRFNKNMMVGADFQYGIGFVNSDKQKECTGGVSCSASDLMFGVQFHYHLMPDQTIDPWGGVGVGYEIGSFSASQGGQSTSSSFSGFQFVNLQLGADYKVMPNLGIGPFVMFSLGEFSGCSVSGPQVPSGYSCKIDNQAMHEWLTFGIRGVYDINLGG